MQLKDDHLTDADLAHSGAPASGNKDVESKLLGAHELSHNNEFEAANHILLEALAQIDALPAQEQHPHLAEVLWSLANNLYLVSLVDECIPYFQRLVEVQEQNLGPEDAALITPLLRLAIALKRAGQAEESEVVFQRSMDLAKRVTPDGGANDKTDGGQSHETKDADKSDASAQSGNSEAYVHPAHDGLSVKESGKSDADSDVLKYLFSDKSPLHNEPVQEPEAEPEPFRFVEGNASTYGDRNPAAARLSDMDLAALGAIPSPAAMKTMFRDAMPVPSDAGARTTKVTAFFKANENTAEPVKFAETVKNFDAKEAAPFMVRYPWLLPAAAIVLIVFVVGYFVKDHLEHTASVAGWDDSISPNALRAVKSYSSFDNKTVLTVLDGDKAILRSGGKSRRAKCFFLEGDPRDFAGVIPGSYVGTHLWLEQAAGGLKEADGGGLYLPDAPMTMVVQQMKLIADRVQAYYKQNHSYPTTGEQMQAALGSAVSHMNPITHKGDSPKFYNTYASSLAASAKKLEDKTAAGESWINETTMAPGEIHCCSLIYQDASGRPDANAMAGGGAVAQAGSSGTAPYFFIRAGDIDGQFIPGSRPGTTFYIKLSDGTSNLLDGNSAELPRDFSKLRILVTKSFSEESFFVFIAGAVPAILVMIIAGGLVVQNGLHDQKDQVATARKIVVKRLSIGASVLLALWVSICLFG